MLVAITCMDAIEEGDGGLEAVKMSGGNDGGAVVGGGVAGGWGARI